MGKTYGQEMLTGCTIFRKTIEGYLDSVPSLTFNTIKTELCTSLFQISAIKMNVLFKPRYNDPSTVHVQIVQPSILKCHIQK